MQEQLGLTGTAAVGKGDPRVGCQCRQRGPRLLVWATFPQGFLRSCLDGGEPGKRPVPLSPPSPTAPLLFSSVGGVSDLDFVQTKDSTAYNTITCSQTWRPGAGQGLAWVTPRSAWPAQQCLGVSGPDGGPCACASCGVIGPSCLSPGSVPAPSVCQALCSALGYRHHRLAGGRQRSAQGLPGTLPSGLCSQVCGRWSPLSLEARGSPGGGARRPLP